MSTTTQTVSTSEAGARITAALGRAYDAIRADHADLPEHVMFITGSGFDGRGLRWGHFRGDLWAARPVIESRRVAGGWVQARIEGGQRAHEVFIGGERLAEGAMLTFQTLLHE